MVNRLGVALFLGMVFTSSAQIAPQEQRRL
jgi:hypothetical protein